MSKEAVSDPNLTRRNYSSEEIGKMIDGMDRVLLAHKKVHEGVDLEDMVKTVRGGKVVWITQDEMNGMLAKQRKVFGTRFRKQATQQENNLLPEINQKIDICRTLIDVLRKTAHRGTADLSRRMRNLEIVHSRSLSSAREIRLYESAIQRKTDESPIADDDEEQSRLKQQRADPYIKKVTECKHAFLQTKQQLFHFEFDLIEQATQILSQEIEKIAQSDKEGKLSRNLVQLVEQIQSLIPRAQPYVQTLKDHSGDTLETQETLFTKLDKDYLTPLFDKVVRLTESFQQAWSQSVKKDPERADSKATTVARAAAGKRAGKRMVFQAGKQRSGK